MRGRTGWLACAVGVLACALYANTLGHGFAYDDARVIVDNSAIHDWTDWRRIFTTPSWFFEGETTIAFRPLTTWTFAVDHALHGLDPFGYHVVNVALHGVVSALVVLVVAVMGLPTAVAGTAGALFAAHPIHTEVVANGVGRAELLAAALALLALWLHRSAGGSTAPGVRRVLSVTAYGLALLAKEHTIAFLVLLPLTDLLLDDGGDFRNFWRRFRGERLVFYTALLLVTLAVLAVRMFALGSVVGGREVANRVGIGFNVLVVAPPGVRVLTALAVLARAIGLLLWPVHLSADYSYAHISLVTGPTDPDAIAGLVVAGCLLGGIRLAWRQSAPACVWLAVALLPWAVVSNLLFLGGTIFGERLLYLPSVGVCALLAMGIAWLARRTSWRIAGAIAMAVLVGWSARTVARNGVWKSDLALAEATVRDAPRSANAHYFLGRAYAGLGRDDDALAPLAEAARLLEAHPGWPERLDILYQTALVEGRLADLSASERLYLEILRHDPDYFPAWINLGALYNGRGDHQQALRAADRAIAARPDVPNSYVVRGTALRFLGRHADALAAFEAALERAPGAIEALFGIGASAIELRDFERATRVFEQVVAAAPSPDAFRGLLMSLRASGHLEEAQRVAALAAQRYPDEPAFRSDAVLPTR